MIEGFYTAVATPINPDGSLCESGYRREIEQQISAGAAGILVMGSMGLLGCAPEWEYEKIISVACDTISGRVRILVGASDNSLARVRDRINIINKYPVDVVVMTAPYYELLTPDLLVSFFERCAAMTQKDFYIYDLFVLTKHKITLPMMLKLVQKPNIKGIKSGDLELIKDLFDLERSEESNALRKDFLPIFSGSNLFCIANTYGIKNYLDGIFSCFPSTMSKIQKAFNCQDYEGARYWMDRMMHVRDVMLNDSLWPMFSYAMNLLGCEGYFGPDYDLEATDEQKVVIRALMQDLGEI